MAMPPPTTSTVMTVTGTAIESTRFDIARCGGVKGCFPFARSSGGNVRLA
jgi:hypothetical protein